VEIVAERVAAALDGLSQYPYVAGRLPRRGAGGPLGVVLVNRGSRARYDDGSRLRELVALAAARLDVPVAPAQAENTPRTIEVAARELHAAGARRIVVVPYLHHPGKVLFTNIIPAIDRAGAEHPDTRFYLAWTLCVDDRLVDLCVRRIAEAGLVVPALSAAV
jgi:sirohydrochlorin ferrochelatase